jgi:hypothetical protein
LETGDAQAERISVNGKNARINKLVLFRMGCILPLVA